MHNRRSVFILASLAVLLGAASCNMPAGGPPALSFPTPMLVTPEFSTAAPSVPAVIVSPTTSSQVPPAATAPQPTAYPIERLNMVAGQTVAYAGAGLALNGRADYLIGALSGQFMMVTVSSANPALILQVQSPDGKLLSSFSDLRQYWQGALPLDGDYVVSVVDGGSSGSNFELSVTIPARIVFAPGATGASTRGTVGPHSITTYLLKALAGQTMTVTVTSTHDDVFLTIYGLQDGQPYLRSAAGEATASINLPVTQDYVIQCVSTADAEEDIKVDFEVK